MKNLSCQFEGLADRQGFNASVRHIKTVVAVVERVEGRENLADVIGELIEERLLDKDEVLPVVAMVLGDKFHYRAVSLNLPSVAQDLATVAEAAGTWNAVDLVAVYHHPDLGPIAVNPKNPKSLARIDRLSRNELLVAWAGRYGKEADAALLDQAAQALAALFAGKTPKPKLDLAKGDCTYKQPKAKGVAASRGPRASAQAKAPAAAPRKKATGAAGAQVAFEHKPAVEAERAVKPGSRMTPMYSVQVTNELFHNGNVEAWKRIIASYNAKYPGLQVLVYYDGERIADINALFKWGKVKHGSTIQFAVAGDDIQGVAKLQRYLAQGASPQFEAFLRGPVNATLPLF